MSKQRAALMAAAVLTIHGGALADTTYLTETFDAATASNGAYGVGTIPNTGVEVVNGYVWIAAATDHGNVLNLGSGWYTTNVDPVTNVGSSTARSIATFDLLAGQSYVLSFDYSRQAWSGGNGPFDTALKVSFGSHDVTYQEVTGFYFGTDWKAGTLAFTPSADELGVHVVFTAFAPPGYSGMLVDNVSLIGLAPVPEPGTTAMLLLGLAVCGVAARSRIKATPL